MAQAKGKKSILIVEDEPELAEVYSTLLNQSGYKVAVAHNGKEALKTAGDHSPDLILLDLRMPVMDGVEFLKKYDLKKSHPDVKVVVFSNYDLQDEIDDAYRLGADRYVLKAWASPRELLQIVQDSLA
ncbi:MAG: DNA-binding response regulator VicR [Candidatus Saccharibacteria bacterium]|nr:DNA-binding response regulator VicR [Candidatus Saccharibacteria bacterium]